MEKEKVDVTFFVPCLNEEKNIRETLYAIFQGVREFPRRCEILAVDDGSSDKSFEILKAVSENHPPLPIRIIRHKKNKGLGYNYFAASHQAGGEYYMMVCGDNVTPSETIKKILAQLGKADMIIPYYVGQDHRSKKRLAISRLFTRFVNLAGGNRLRYYNGQNLFRTEDVRQASLKVPGFGGQAELICKLLHEGRTFIHVHVTNYDRPFGSTRAFRPSNILATAGSLCRILWRRLRR